MTYFIIPVWDVGKHAQIHPLNIFESVCVNTVKLGRKTMHYSIFENNYCLHQKSRYISNLNVLHILSFILSDTDCLTLKKEKVAGQKFHKSCEIFLVTFKQKVAGIKCFKYLKIKKTAGNLKSRIARRKNKFV